MIRFLIALLVLQACIIGLYVLSGKMAFSADPNGAWLIKDEGMDTLLSWLDLKKLTLWQIAQKIILLAGGMTALLFVISHFPIVFLWLMIVYDTGLTAYMLCKYANALLDLPLRTKILLFAAIALAVNAWIVTVNWATIDCAAWLIGVMLLIQFRKTSFRAAVLLSAGIMLYDATAVFGTHVMQHVATTQFMALPVLFSIPASLSLSSPAILHLGLGDVVLPGAIVMMAIRESIAHKRSVLAVAALGGYVAGFIATIVVMVLFRFPQPATIYLMPGTLLGFTLAAWRGGLLKKIANRSS
ncbi:hypothetical protein KGO95_02885 [Patescibacteria group bacterium]|nr:hypothetical protein [Patescibacteria group bacterium]